MSHARQVEQFRDAREFKIQICAWLRSRMSMGMRLSTALKGRRIVDAATCARDVYHREHRGASCMDFHLELQCGKLCAILVFWPRAPARTVLPMCTSMPANNITLETAEAAAAASVCTAMPVDTAASQ